MNAKGRSKGCDSKRLFPVDTFFDEYPGEEKKGKCWLLETWDRRLVFNKLIKTSTHVGCFQLKKKNLRCRREGVKSWKR